MRRPIRGLAAPVKLRGLDDQALDCAKEHGRNQICFYVEPIQRGGLDAHGAAGEAELF